MQAQRPRSGGRIGDYLVRVWEDLLGRASGPMKIRLVLQPLVSAFFAIRAGRRDAREGRPPYLWTLFSQASERRGLLKESWLDVGRVFLAAVAIDLVYQFAVLHAFRPGEAAIVAGTLALLPYFAARGLVTRISRKLGLD